MVDLERGEVFYDGMSGYAHSSSNDTRLFLEGISSDRISMASSSASCECLPSTPLTDTDSASSPFAVSQTTTEEISGDDDTLPYVVHTDGSVEALTPLGLPSRKADSFRPARESRSHRLGV